MKEVVLYLCDPGKNTDCSKRNCAYRRGDAGCFSTKNPEFARLSESGTPIITGVAIDAAGK